MNSKDIITSSNQDFDWKTTFRRIAEIKANSARDGKTTRESLERKWAEHARQLAKPRAKEDEGKFIDLAFIQLGEEVYALNVDYVFDICPAQQITPVPHVPDWVCGVFNLRGYVLSVVEFARFLGLPQSTKGEKSESETSLVVVKTQDMECAFLVDQVVTVATLPVAQIRPPSEIIRGLPATYEQGIIAVNGEEGTFTAVILNAQAILADERLIVNQNIL